MVEIPVADLSTRFDLSPTLIERMRAELTLLAVRHKLIET